MNAKKLCAALAVLGLVLLGGGASAELGTIDAVPAATLLLPYFEVDLDDVDGVNTLFSINNASAAPTVAHVVVWSDTTVPLLDFNVYLTGYDVQTLSMRDIIVNGTLPDTADEDSDGADTISPTSTTGGIPAPLVDWNAVAMPHPSPFASDDGTWDQSFSGFDAVTGCGGPPGAIPPILQDRLQEGLTGNATQFDGTCVGFNHGDRIARGYVTVDNVNTCNISFPGDAGYFDPVSGLASNVNQLWGDFFIVTPGEDFAIGETLVHVEADASLAVPGQTFYGRFVTFSGADAREALGNQYATRYVDGGGFDGGTDLIVWREGAPWNPAAGDGQPHACISTVAPGGPSWFPMNELNVVAFDETEQWAPLCFPTTTTSPISPNTGTSDDPVCFPLEAQRVKVGDADDNLHGGALAPPWNFGWMFLDLQAGGNTIENQAWVVTNMSALGRFSVGFDAIQLNNLTGDTSPVLTQ